MAITAIPFKGNASVTFNAVAFGGLRSASVSSTVGTWDSTAFDNTSGSRTFTPTYNTSTCSMTGVWDGTDAGQTTFDTLIVDGTAHSLVVTFESLTTYTVSAILTEWTIEGDYEGGWTWSASFQAAGAPAWALA